MLLVLGCELPFGGIEVSVLSVVSESNVVLVVVVVTVDLWVDVIDEDLCSPVVVSLGDGEAQTE